MTQFNEDELSYLKKIVDKEMKKAEADLKRLNESSDSFLVNEGIVNEVRIETQRHHDRIKLLTSITSKLND